MAAVAVKAKAEERIGIPKLCDEWARWAHTWDGPVKGLPMASIVANKFKFQKERTQILDRVSGLHVTARGRQTRVMTAGAIADNPEMESVDRAIASLREQSPGTNLVLIAEHIGYYPILRDEAFTPGRDSLWTRMQTAWAQGRGFTIASLERQDRETADMWRERIGKKLGVSRTTFYALLREGYQYIGGYRGAILAVNGIKGFTPE